MNYEEFQDQKSFSKEEVLAFAHGNLFDDAPPEFKVQLPAPPMLMIDRILEIRAEGARGRIVAERDVAIDDWFFQCHFRGDPVQPGCLGVDGVWQLLGFYCGVERRVSAPAGPSAVERSSSSGQIRPHDRVRALRGGRAALYGARAGPAPRMVIGDATSAGGRRAHL